MYRRRQRLFLEMEQMASRAFSQVIVEIERRDIDSTDPEHGDTDFSNCRKKKKVNVTRFIFKYFTFLIK